MTRGTKNIINMKTGSGVKLLQLLVVSALFLSLVSCNNDNKNLWKLFPRNTFDEAFPKKNKDLSDILGSHLVLKMDKDTVKLKVTKRGDLNLVSIENSGDTLFCGTVCKFRGLYYFSQKISDTAYWIFAVKRAGDKLYGINGMLVEGLQIDKEALSGKYPGLVKYINKDTSVIRLHTDKKMIKKMLENYVDSLTPYTILEESSCIHTQFSLEDTGKYLSEIDSDEFDLMSKVYPNPATNEINLEVKQVFPPSQHVTSDDTYARMWQYNLVNISGKSIKTGHFNEFKYKIDISDIPSGLYLLTVSSPDYKIWEAVKVIKE
jgi:hypothetical protein